MSAADDLTEPYEDAEQDGGTFGDLMEMFVNQGTAFQTDIIARAIRKDPTIIGGILFPDEPDGERRLGHTMELNRLIDRDRALEAYQLIRASKAMPLYPAPLEYVAQRLSDGLLQRPAPSVGGLLYPARVKPSTGLTRGRSEQP